LVSELVKRIPPVSPINPLKEDKLARKVTRCNPKTYSGSYDPMGLEEWIRGMEKIFVVIKVPDEKRVNIVTFYLSKERQISDGIL